MLIPRDHSGCFLLVQWSHLPAELSTKQDEEALRQEFPHALAWGQAGLQ
jgi:hypothetical protein